MTVAYLLPPAWWPVWGRLSARLWRATHRRTHRARVTHIARVLGEHGTREQAEHIARAQLRDRSVERLALLRQAGPGRWTPTVTLNGADHLDAALTTGCGAILWIADFRGSNLPYKLAFHQHGYAVSHLSGSRHGISDTRFGIRFLNPILLGVELRYLKERILISGADRERAWRTLRALRTLQRRLAANGVVSVTALVRQYWPVQIPIMAGAITLPLGAPRLSYESGAALLPVFTKRLDDGCFEVIIEPPIELDRSLPRQEASVAAAERFGARLRDEVSARPEQWNNWHFVEVSSERSDGT